MTLLALLARRSIALLGISLLAITAGCSEPSQPRRQDSATDESQVFTATAYSIEGKTASGKHAREGICAGDPNVLPLGTRIRVSDAGSYSGEYVVADTGAAIRGHEIDIYLRDDSAAKRFGRRKVRVQILGRAD